MPGELAGQVDAAGDKQGLGALQVIGDVEYRGPCVQKDHVVLPHQPRGVAGDALLLPGVALLGGKVRLPCQKLLLLQAGGPSVDLDQLALTGQSVQVPADGGLGGSSGLTQLGHADGLVLGKLL